MAYDEHLAERIKRVLKDKRTPFVEKKMFGGVAYMVDDKMCVGIIKDELMVRLNPDYMEEALKIPGCRPMDFTKRPMKGYVQVVPEAIDLDEDLSFWIQIGLDFNPIAKPSKKK
jgi:TfoX/Sxy family transcriptional regulator of competence genes